MKSIFLLTMFLFLSAKVSAQATNEINYGVDFQSIFYHINIDELAYDVRNVPMHPKDIGKYPLYNMWAIGRLKYDLWSDVLMNLYVQYRFWENFGVRVDVIYYLNNNEDCALRNYTTENIGTEKTGGDNVLTFVKIYKAGLLGTIFKQWRALDASPQLFFTQSYPNGFRAYASISYASIIVSNGWHRYESTEEYKDSYILADCIPIGMKMYFSVYKTTKVNIEFFAGMTFLNMIRKHLGVKSGLTNEGQYYHFGVSANFK